MQRRASMTLAALGSLLLGVSAARAESALLAAPPAGINAPAESVDSAFLQAETARCLAQMAVAGQAQSLGQNPDLKQYASKLNQAYQRLTQQMQTIAARQSVKLPAQTGLQQPYYCGSCVSARGAAFDSQYLDYQVFELPRLINDFRYLATYSPHAAVRTWAKNWQPVFESYLRYLSRFGSRYAVNTGHLFNYGYYYPTYYPYGYGYGYGYGSSYYPYSYSYYPYGTLYYPYGYGYGYYPYGYGYGYYPYGYGYGYGYGGYGYGGYYPYSYGYGVYYPYGTYYGGYYYPGLLIEPVGAVGDEKSEEQNKEQGQVEQQKQVKEEKQQVQEEKQLQEHQGQEQGGQQELQQQPF